MKELKEKRDVAAYAILRDVRLYKKLAWGLECFISGRNSTADTTFYSLSLVKPKKLNIMESVLLLSVLYTMVSLFIFTGTQASPSTTSVILNTSLGDVLGIRKAVGAGESAVEIFYGIPFAQPPVGNRRFRPPLPAQSWGSTTLDGTIKPKACWQEIDTSYKQFSGVDMWNPNTERDEDCLYLNVWRPEGSQNSYQGSGDGDDSDSSHKTIMVWIFGGGFTSGSAVLDVYEASQLAVREGVIVISIAYRLGPFGFLYLGNGEVPGNVGLLDQAMALQWIRDNAINLGGSPDDITIFGESAGAASVGLHLLSPMSRHLFKNAIMQSTTPLAEWAVMDRAKATSRALELSRKLSCLNDTETDATDIDTSALLACLQGKNPALISSEQWNITGMKSFDVTFAPVVDGNFLIAEPAEMINNGDIKITNVIVGVTKDEGIYFDLYAFNIQLNCSGELTEQHFDEIMLAIADNDVSFKEQLIATYTEEEGDSPMDIVDAASGDAWFKCSVVNFAQKYAQLGGQVYKYSFEENLSSNPWPDWMGVPHGYEIEAVFGIPLAPGSNNTSAEKDLSSQVMKMWANFAKTGSPSGNDEDIAWPLYTTGDKQYVKIDAHGLHREDDLRDGLCQLWTSSHQSSNATSTDFTSQSSNATFANAAIQQN
ncbi:carboxylic ester hydrolase [Plakobranchus ocellatus]|uniref:Carboxylic ester hydrolase n=1 Tax=Plakobranchus ocellatus TaxID=259542 RepID=A0AAV3Z8U7_9GAST|nr:carboxylic ester hydrolase [Plakobranchus ocellatus]